MSAQQTFKTGVAGITATEVAQSQTGFSVGSAIVAPIPFSNPLIKSGLALGAGYLFTLPGSKPSGFGVAGLQSSNDSTGWGAGASINFAQGYWTATLIGGEADVFYDLPLANDANLPLNQQGTIASLTLRRGISETVNLGIEFSQLDTEIKIESELLDLLPPALQPDLDVKLHKIHLLLGYDTRDNTFYPTQGILADASLAFGMEVDSAFGNEFELASKSYLKLLANSSIYRELPNAAVMAARASFCAAGDEAPFFDTCGLGLTEGIRGFSAFDFLGNYSASLQAEYRGRFNDRFGYVAFAGGGGTNDKLGDVISDLHMAVGVGLRIRLSKEFKLDYAVDYALNDAGDHLVYLTIGQKF